MLGSKSMFFRSIAQGVLVLALVWSFGSWAEITGEPACDVWPTITAQADGLYTILGKMWQSTGGPYNDIDGNQMPDKYEASLLAAALCTETMPYHTDIRAAFQANLATLRGESHYATSLQAYEYAIVSMTLISQSLGYHAIRSLKLTGDYPPFRADKASAEPFSWLGDYDGDGSMNYCEYTRVVAELGNRNTYVGYASNASELGTTACDPTVAAVPNFCTSMDTLAGNEKIRKLLGDNATMLDLLYCNIADVNGGIDPRLELPAPNGMLDGAFELGLIAAVLSDKNFDLSSGTLPGQVRPGVNFDTTYSAYQMNVRMLRADISEGIIEVLNSITGNVGLADHLINILCAVMLLGDSDSAATMKYLFALIGDYALNKNPNFDVYGWLPAYYSSFGDADGDGYCNRAEYNAFFDAANPSAYIEAALDPTIHPSGNVTCPGTAFVFSQKYYFNAYTGHIYRMTPAPFKWEDCEAYAVNHTLSGVSLPGHLVTINTADENQWILDTMPAYVNSWIGMNDAAVEGTWRWVSGEPVSYTNWEGAAPTLNTDDDYARFYGKSKGNPGKWNARDQQTYLGIVEIAPPDGETWTDTDIDGVPETFDDADFDGIPDGWDPAVEGGVECASACTDSCASTGLTIYNAWPMSASVQDNDGNGMDDMAHGGLLVSILGNPDSPVHCCVLQAYEANQKLVQVLINRVNWTLVTEFTEDQEPALKEMIVQMVTTGDRATLEAVRLFFDYKLKMYVLPEMFNNGAEMYLAAYGDADLDGVCNLGEYNAGVDGFVARATDPSVKTDGGGCPLDCTQTEEGEGTPEGVVEGNPEGVVEGNPEGVVEGNPEGVVEGNPEGVVEGNPEGVVEGNPEGVVEGNPEGVVEGNPEGTPEGISEGEGEGGAATIHAADQNGDNKINLTELLRVIQFFNLRGFHCAANPGDSEDGYLPGAGTANACAPHTSDYNPQDWKISLTELLRLIQFFNLRGYHACPGTGTEDDFCPGL